jgi:hypothetical protein
VRSVAVDARRTGAGRPRRESRMDAMLERLLRQAHLFDDPGIYEAGVRDAFDALESMLDDEQASTPA